MTSSTVKRVRMGGQDFHRPLYVLSYHPWLDGFQEYFSTQLTWLKDHGFETISLEALVSYLRGEEVSIPERPIAMTFDDGTIENFTIVCPLLKKFGYSGTVFALTARKYIQMSGDHWWRQVEEEGVLRIEGHSHTHAFIFINDHVDDFYSGKEIEGVPYVKGLDKKLGFPLFGLGHELVSKRFIPRRELIEVCVDYVLHQGAEDFFRGEDRREELFRFVSRYQGGKGRFETEREKERRVRRELEISRRRIEQTIGGRKEVKFFAYPYGAYDFALIQTLKKSGYVGAFTCDPGENRRGDDPFLIKRVMILKEESFGGLPHLLKGYLETD